MGQIVSSAAKPKRCNKNQLSQVPTPAAGEYILVSSDNSMNAAGQGNFDCYIVGNGTTAATALKLKSVVDDIFDISSYHATDGVLAKYADLAAALGTNGANIPEGIRKGGMSVKFVQSSDNKYVQYMYVETSTAVVDFTNTDNWEKVIIDEDLKEFGQQLVQGWVKGITFAGLYTDGTTTYTATSRFNGLLIYLPAGVKSVKIKSAYGFTNQARAGYTTLPTVGMNKDVEVSRTVSNNIYTCTVSSNTNGIYILLTIDTKQGQGAFNKENVCVSLDVVKEQRIANLESIQSALVANVATLANVNPTLVSIIQGYVKGIDFAGLYTDGTTTYTAIPRFNGLLVYLPPRVTKVIVKSEYGFNSQSASGYTSKPSAGSTKDVTIQKSVSGNVLTYSVTSNMNGLYVLMTIDTAQGTFNKDDVIVTINDIQEEKTKSIDASISSLTSSLASDTEKLDNLKIDTYNGSIRGFSYGGMAYLGGTTLSAAAGNFDGFLLFAEPGTERLYISGLTYLDGAVRKNAANAILTFDTSPVVGVTHYLSSRPMSIVGEDVVVTFPNNTNGFYVYVSMNKTLVTLANIGVIIGWRQDKKIEETNARINLLNPFKGKVFVNFGDSIIGNPRGNSPGIDDSISTLLAAAIEATCYNGGFGGCRMATHSSPAWDAFSMHSLADSIASGDWSVQDDAITNYGQTYIDAGVTYFPQTVTMLKGIDWSSVNYITISYGTNDFADNVPLESPNPTHQWDTYKGALEYSLDKILTAYPNIKIIVTTPIWRCWLSGGTIMEDSDEKVNTNGDKLTDFVSAVLNVCGSIHVLGINMYSMLGFNRYTKSLYFNTNDGTHPNEEGRKRMVGMLAGQLRSNF